MKAPTQVLTQVEWSPEDFEIGIRIAEHLGYRQYAYTSTSDLWGMFCHRQSGTDPKRPACIIKTRELGFLIVQDLYDHNLTPEGKSSAL